MKTAIIRNQLQTQINYKRKSTTNTKNVINLIHHS